MKLTPSGRRAGNASFPQRRSLLSKRVTLLLLVCLCGTGLFGIHVLSKYVSSYSQTTAISPATSTQGEPSLGPSPTPSRVPKIALLFLTQGPLPHEDTWAAWFNAAGALIPRAAALSVCREGPQGREALQDLCGLLEDPRTPRLQRQALFSVYLHAPPQFKGYNGTSLWANARIAAQVSTKWADHSLVTATRELLSAALQDPTVERFVLISETDIPIYDPLTVYSQLMAEQRSRINACPGEMTTTMPWRWTAGMQTESMNVSHWRKSAQWFGLTRKHAQAVVDDQEINQRFEQFCFYERDPKTGRLRDCVSDEHYIPTLLAVLGLEDECACDSWGVAAVDWSRGHTSHPTSYTLKDISVELIRKIRGLADDVVHQAQADANERLLDCRHGLMEEPARTCADLLQEVGLMSTEAPLPGTPPLFARKFPAETAQAVRRLAVECDRESVMLLGPRHCLEPKAKMESRLNA